MVPFLENALLQKVPQMAEWGWDMGPLRTGPKGHMGYRLVRNEHCIYVQLSLIFLGEHLLLFLVQTESPLNSALQVLLAGWSFSDTVRYSALLGLALFGSPALPGGLA